MSRFVHRTARPIEFTADRQMDLLQQRTSEAVRLLNGGVTRGQLVGERDARGGIRAVTLLAATNKKLNHNLRLPVGQAPTGWIVVDKDAAAFIYRVAWDEKTITLVSDVEVNALFWVFA